MDFFKIQDKYGKNIYYDNTVYKRKKEIKETFTYNLLNSSELKEQKTTLKTSQKKKFDILCPQEREGPMV